MRKKRGPYNIQPRWQTIDEIRERVEVSSSGCWIWPTRRWRGYANIRFSGRFTTVHRVAWELTHGPISEGMHVCHTCDTPGCANPDHLFIGTRADNMRDCVAKGRHFTPFAAGNN